jgi:hypothetical protein
MFEKMLPLIMLTMFERGLHSLRSQLSLKNTQYKIDRLASFAKF